MKSRVKAILLAPLLVLGALLLYYAYKHINDRNKKYYESKENIEIQYRYANKCLKTICNTSFQKNQFCQKSILYRLKSSVSGSVYTDRNTDLALMSHRGRYLEILAYATDMEKRLKSSSFKSNVCGVSVKNDLNLSDIEGYAEYLKESRE